MRVSLAPVLLLLASAAAAQPGAGAMGRPHGQVFIAPSGEPFRAAPGEPYPVAKWFAEADTDLDGRLTLAEFTADFERFFKSLDQDGDGKLRFAEINRYEQEVAPEVQAYEPGGLGGRRGKDKVRYDPNRPIGGGRYGLLDIPEPVVSMDTDMNGVVTLDDVRQAAAQRFRLIDTKQQGYLTLADLPKTWAQQEAEAAAARQRKEQRRRR